MYIMYMYSYRWRDDASKPRPIYFALVVSYLLFIVSWGYPVQIKIILENGDNLKIIALSTSTVEL